MSPAAVTMIRSYEILFIFYSPSQSSRARLFAVGTGVLVGCMRACCAFCRGYALAVALLLWLLLSTSSLVSLVVEEQEKGGEGRENGSNKNCNLQQAGVLSATMRQYKHDPSHALSVFLQTCASSFEAAALERAARSPATRCAPSTGICSVPKPSW